MSWTRKLLRVDLSKGTCSAEPVNMDWVGRYLGQRGLASKYLSEEVDPKVDPLSPANKLMFTTGPLTGTGASTGGRYSVVTKGPLTGAIACSNSGGFFGAELKFAGWDLIVFEGRAARPVYLSIENDHAEILPAGDFIWGKTVWETEEAIHARHGDPQIRIASIGKAGETGCLFAAIVNDLHRAAGRSGVGAVMGAKNLKAVAVRGTLGVRVANPEAFAKAADDGKAALATNGVTSQGLPTYGTQVLVNIINECGAFPTHNGRDVQFAGARKISGEAMHEKRPSDGKANLVRNGACFGCTIACGRISQIDKGHFSVTDKPKYWEPSGGVEYEAAWALGAATGVDDLDALTYANFICNEQGMDPITLGSTVGAAMELYEIGAITGRETGGLELKFGSAHALCKAVDLCATGEGFGREIALGSKRLCEKYGHPDLSMTVKGQEFPAYDPRGIQGIGLEYATSNRGACHVRGYTIASEVLATPVKTDPLVTSGKAELCKAFQDLTAVVDSAGICLFTTFAWGMPEIAPQIDAACGGGWTVDRLLEVGERIWNLERRFNLAAGLTAKDDTLPKRILTEPATTGPAKGNVNRLHEMLPEYYKLRGWTPDGVPSSQTVERLAL